MKRMMQAAVVLVAVVSSAAVVRAQDPVQVDPKHYKVEFENDAVRVLRVSYGAGEKSVMHVHPQSIAIFLTDQKAKMTLPDGKSEVVEAKAGEAKSIPAGAHLPENVGAPLQLILVELKGKPVAK